MSKPTCGPLYLAALKRYARTQSEELLFAAGFVYGEAEKIYLGACGAAMFRPSAEMREWLDLIVREAAEHYGLLFRPLNTSRGEELWLLRDQKEDVFFRRLTTEPENTVPWHRIRALLCGIPMTECDDHFHERRGFGERCDGIKA